VGERIVWVLERSGGSNPVKTEAKSIATSPPELGGWRQKAPCEVFFPAACASREALASFSPQRERTDPHDPRSLRTESFRDLTPCDSEGGLRAADFAAQRRAALGGEKLSKPLCFLYFSGASERFAAEGAQSCQNPCVFLLFLARASRTPQRERNDSHDPRSLCTGMGRRTPRRNALWEGATERRWRLSELPWY